MIAYVRALPGAREFVAPRRLSWLASAVSRLGIGGQGGLTAAEQAFMSAAQTGNVEALNAAIAEGVQVDRLGDDGKSALIRASGAGHVAAVELLLKAGADPSLMNGGVTALHVAATDGHLEVIRVLVQAKANVNRRSSDTSDTPLMAAVKAEKPEVVRALIDAGADTTVSDSGFTALQYAVSRANTAVVREMVKDGRTPVNARHPTSHLAEGSPLHGALWCKNPDYNIELIQTLLAAGADLAATDKNGDTPIKAAERKRAAEKLPYYQTCYDAQVAALRSAATTR
jgi:ankyrin repeat protein